MLATLAVATNTAPSVWVRELESDPRMVATVLDILRVQHGG